MGFVIHEQSFEKGPTWLLKISEDFYSFDQAPGSSRMKTRWDLIYLLPSMVSGTIYDRTLGFVRDGNRSSSLTSGLNFASFFSLSLYERYPISEPGSVRKIVSALNSHKKILWASEEKTSYDNPNGYYKS